MIFSVLGFMAQKQKVPVSKVVQSGKCYSDLGTVTWSLINIITGRGMAQW